MTFASEPQERRVVIGVILALAATIALLHAETLFGGRIYHADDVGEGYWPSRVAILRALAAGEIPDWEPRAWGGYPLVAVPNYGTFYPPNALFLIFGAARGVAWSVAAHQLAGGVGMLALLRRRGLILPAASFGAFAYALGTFSVERIRHLAFEQAIAWIPLLLLGLDDILGARTRRGVVLAGLALGFVCLAGALPLVPFVCAIAIAYALRRAGRSLRVWGGLVASLGFAACVGAAQLVPTLWHLALSPRRSGLSYEYASRHAWPDFRWIVTLLAPDMWGTPHFGRYFGPPTHWELAGYYSGALAVALAFLAPVIRKRELAALAVLSVLGVGLALGVAGPIHPVLFRFMPGYRSLRCPARALIVVAVAVPILAAEGIHRLRGARPSERALRGWLAALLASGLLLLAVRVSPSSGGLPVERQMATSHLALQVVALCGGGALVATGVAYARVAWAATALLAIDLFTIGHAYLEPWSAESPMALARNPAVRRMLAVVGDDRAAFGQGVDIGANNFGLAADFRSIGGYDPFPVWRWVELLWIASTGAPYPHSLLTEDVGVGHLDRFESPLVDALNVRWLVSTAEPGAGWTERTGDTPAGPRELRLFENLEAMPPAFLVHRVRVERDSGAQAQAVAQIDPRREVVLDDEPSPSPTAAEEPFLPAQVVSRTRTRLEIETEDPNDAVLVVSETMYPGWRARIDGQPASIHYANYAMRGVAVPLGRHRVEMWFEPPWGRTGETLTLASIALAGAIAARSLVRRRRRATPRRSGRSVPPTARRP